VDVDKEVTTHIKLKIHNTEGITQIWK